MLTVKFRRNSQLHRLLSTQRTDFIIGTRSTEERVKLLIVRDLLRLGWEVSFKADQSAYYTADVYDKQVVKESMQIKRQVSLLKHRQMVRATSILLDSHLADGSEVWNSKINPVHRSLQNARATQMFSGFFDSIGHRLTANTLDVGLSCSSAIIACRNDPLSELRR